MLPPLFSLASDCFLLPTQVGADAKQRLNSSYNKKHGIAVCAVADIKILPTWNFKYVANGSMMKKIQHMCAENGFDYPQLLTQLQLLGDHHVD